MYICKTVLQIILILRSCDISKIFQVFELVLVQHSVLFHMIVLSCLGLTTNRLEEDLILITQIKAGIDYV